MSDMDLTPRSEPDAAAIPKRKRKLAPMLLLVVVLVAGLGTAQWIIGAAALGAVAGMPIAWLVARAVTTRTAAARA